MELRRIPLVLAGFAAAGLVFAGTPTASGSMTKAKPCPAGSVAVRATGAEQLVLGGTGGRCVRPRVSRPPVALDKQLTVAQAQTETQLQGLTDTAFTHARAAVKTAMFRTQLKLGRLELVRGLKEIAHFGGRRSRAGGEPHPGRKVEFGKLPPETLDNQATAEASGYRVEGADDEVGAGGEVTSTVTLRNGAKSSMTKKEIAFVDKCPNSVGAVPGEYESRYATTVPVDAKGVRVTVAADMVVKADLMGHVGDNGHLVGYDYQGDVTMELKSFSTLAATGKLLGHAGTQVLRWHFTKRGAKAEKGLFDGLDAVFRGPKGEGDTAQQNRAIALLGAALVGLEIEAESRFLDAEKNWYGEGENGVGGCTDVSVKPEKTSLTKGEKSKIQVSVNAKKDGKEVRATLSAQGCPGDVTPRSAKFTPGHPVEFEYTAPASGTDAPCFVVRSTGPTGRGEGTQRWPGPTTFLVSVDGTQTTTYSKQYTSSAYPACPNFTGHGTQTIHFTNAGTIKLWFVRDPAGGPPVDPLEGARLKWDDKGLPSGVVLEALQATVERQGELAQQGGGVENTHCPAGGGEPPAPDCGTRTVKPFETDLLLTGEAPVLGGASFYLSDDPYRSCFYEDALRGSAWKILPTPAFAAPNGYAFTQEHVFDWSVDFYLAGSATKTAVLDTTFDNGDRNHSESTTTLRFTITLTRTDDPQYPARRLGA